MRSNKEMAEEVLRRAESMERQKAAQKRIVYSVIAVAACLVLVVGLSFAMPALLPDFVANGSQAGVHNATMFAGGTAGSFVLVGVIAFTLGVAVTLFCVRVLNKKQ